MLRREAGAFLDAQQAGLALAPAQRATRWSAQRGIKITGDSEPRNGQIGLARKSGQRQIRAKILVRNDRRALEQLGVDCLQYLSRCFAVDHAQVRARMPDARDAERKPAQHALEPAFRERRIDAVAGHKTGRDGDPLAIAPDHEIAELEVFYGGVLKHLVVGMTLHLIGEEIGGRRGVMFNSQHVQAGHAFPAE